MGAVTPAGIADCVAKVNAGDYWWSPSCWMYSPSAWVQMASFVANAPKPLTTPPAAPSTVQQETQPGDWTPDQAVTQTEQDAQAAAVQQMAKVPFVPPGGGSTGLSTLDWLANLFGGENGDGTSNPAGLSTTAIIALGLAAGAVLLLVTSGGRRRR